MSTEFGEQIVDKGLGQVNSTVSTASSSPVMALIVIVVVGLIGLAGLYLWKRPAPRDPLVDVTDSKLLLERITHIAKRLDEHVEDRKDTNDRIERVITRLHERIDAQAALYATKDEVASLRELIQQFLDFVKHRILA